MAQTNYYLRNRLFLQGHYGLQSDEKRSLKLQQIIFLSGKTFSNIKNKFFRFNLIYINKKEFQSNNLEMKLLHPYGGLLAQQNNSQIKYNHINKL
ncbi:unnamed protein product [Paramecium pentaurelia]|uniref:Uncharacterized protein n=1 Tax=Paramecium pentaurelia TaxID=43138 RepID=A0A8S1THV7_9CILI|nr:unnamed protein product [Paramecium pentaurelia]